ncbi:hypothetical protein R1flu_026184 [Riccia fluitans]|uniref:non-specific serine/threonine protein kinase n=1 Tax=Riccia fluitans TaxID=41844 RepID=A0ABD1XF84_9MARC
MGDDHDVDILGYATDNATQSEDIEVLSVSDPESGGDGLSPGTSEEGEVLFTLYAGEGGRPPGIPEQVQVPFLTFEELQTATNDFSDENLVDRNGHCVKYIMYKGFLPVFPFLVTVKIYDTAGLSDPSRAEGFTEIRRELQALRLCRHPNIVRIWGADTKEEDGKFISVLEGLPSGTLGHRLCTDQAGKISWDVSLGIALDIANGLSYIHEDLLDQEQLVHFNLSPSSIFFSGDIAKIGSFERSEKLERGTARRIRVLARNIGYTAPEAVKDGVVSSKNDVYSFGVILLEMITGLKPADYDILLKGGIRTFVVDNFSSIVDSLAAPEPGLKELRKSISLMVNTGLQCTENNPEDRPTMKEVVVRFKAITEIGSKEDSSLFPAPQEQSLFTIPSESGNQYLQTYPSETISIHFRSSAGRSRSGLNGVQRRSSGGKLFKYFVPLCGSKDNQKSISR